MSENAEKCPSVFPKAHGDMLKSLFCPQPKDIPFAVIEEQRNIKIFTFDILEYENVEIFSQIMNFSK